MRLIEYVRLFVDMLIEFIFGLFARPKLVLPPIRDELLEWSATALAGAIRSRRVTVERVVRAYIERIAEVNVVLNALVDDRFEAAVAEAVALDARIADCTPEDFAAQPLLGVPFTAKESTLCAGMACTFGLVSRQGERADHDAAVVANMRRAGAILLGVTNVPQLNLWVETHNPIYGLTCNPYDTSRSAGGSSGGEAALIAACASPIGVGTDIGGSIRIPAFMCGIFGHKCTNGLTDTEGLTFRTGAENATTMVTTGPLARTAEDLLIGVRVLLGNMAADLKLNVPVDTRALKYHFVESNDDMRCSPIRADMEYILKMVIDHFRGDRTVEKLIIPKLKYSSALYKYWLEQEGADFAFDVTNRQYRACAKTELLRYLLCRSEFSFPVIMNLVNNQWLPEVPEDWAVEVTDEIRQFLLDKLGTDGVLIYPSWPQTATLHHVAYLRPYNFAYTSIFNALKLPATQVPLGLSKDGLPVGVQVVAAPYNDRLCIAVARELEHIFGGYVPPPMCPLTK